eukprot:gene12498-12632_t
MALLLPRLPGSAEPAAAGGGTSKQLGAAMLSQLLPQLQVKLGVEPPTLARLLRVLLTCHKGWFRVQRCQDPFAAALQIDQLLQPESGGSGVSFTLLAQQFTTPSGRPGAAAEAGTVVEPALPEAAGGGASAATAAGNRGSQDDMVVEEDELGDFDESAVLQVMEVLELPRATALELLVDHGGDAQAVILAVFGA